MPNLRSIFRTHKAYLGLCEKSMMEFFQKYLKAKTQSLFLKKSFNMFDKVMNMSLNFFKQPDKFETLKFFKPCLELTLSLSEYLGKCLMLTL